MNDFSSTTNITSAANATFRHWLKLVRQDGIRHPDTIIVEGYRAIAEIRRSGLAVISYIFSDKTNIKDTLNQLNQATAERTDYTSTSYNPASYVLSNHLFEKLCQTKNPQAILALVSVPHIPRCTSPALQSKRILLLESVQDPGNLGTLMRSAAAFSWQEIWLCGDCASPYNAKVIRATMGAFGIIKIVQYPDALKAIQALHASDFFVLGAAMQGMPLAKLQQHKFSKLAVILGNEGKGLLEQTMNLCNELVAIEQTANVESLNVGVAGGILCYELALNKVS